MPSRACRSSARPACRKVINGPIPYAPDGNPLIGPMPGVPNAFEACVFTFGIAQAGGAGKVLAEWVTEGQTEWDMWSCDPRRFTAFAAPGLLRRQGHGSLRPRICDPVSRATPGRPAATRSCRRSMTGSRRSARSSTPIMAGSAPTGTRKPGDDTSEESHADLPARRAVAEAYPRRMPCRARRRRHSRSARLLALPAAGRGRARMAVDADHRHRAEARPHRPWLFLRRQGPHRHRNVDHGARRGFLLPDHGGGRRMA